MMPSSLPRRAWSADATATQKRRSPLKVASPGDEGRSSLLAGCHHPAGIIDVEDDAVGILELALEALVPFLAEIEEELAPGRLDGGLLLLQVVDLETEMMDADEALRVLQAGTDLALVLQQRQIDLAVVHVDATRRRPFRHFRPAEPERLLIEGCRLLQVLDYEGDMPNACQCVAPYWRIVLSIKLFRCHISLIIRPRLWLSYGEPGPDRLRRGIRR